MCCQLCHKTGLQGSSVDPDTAAQVDCGTFLATLTDEGSILGSTFLSIGMICNSKNLKYCQTATLNAASFCGCFSIQLFSATLADMRFATGMVNQLVFLSVYCYQAAVAALIELNAHQSTTLG